MGSIPLDPSPLGKMGPKRLQILNRKSEMTVGLLGAKLSLILEGVPILTSFGQKRYNGEPAVTHPCSPNFRLHGSEFGLPLHGPVRNTLQQVVSYNQTPSGGDIELTSESQAGTYPAGLVFNQKFSMRNGVFSLVTIHRNKGKRSLPVVSGEHFYWEAGNGGWEGIIINGGQAADLIRGDTVGEIRPENYITVPNYAIFRLRQSGYRVAVHWSMPHAGKPRGYDQHYFCYEPVEFDPADFGNPETLIHPGKQRTSRLEISLIEDLRKH